jgi:hypothetical protein
MQVAAESNLFFLLMLNSDRRVGAIVEGIGN